jgi:ATP-dependent helicase HrpA
MPKDFVSRYPSERLTHIQRYIKALILRAQRGYANPAKDQAKEQEFLRLRRLWEQQLQRLPHSASAEKKAVLQDLGWLLEEYKVAVFAPELKTAGKVSPGRFMKRLDEIAGML